jgi:nicotinate-nucleotide adenylyltransferase
VLATLEEPYIFVSTNELESPDKPYTVETLERLRAFYGEQASLFFIMGADSFEEINTWREPERLLAGASLIVAARPGYQIITSHLSEAFRSAVVDLRGGASPRQAVDVEGRQCCYIYLTDYVCQDVSATQIRQRVGRGLSIGGMVPPRVAEYIEKYELYRR